VVARLSSLRWYSVWSGPGNSVLILGKWMGVGGRSAGLPSKRTIRTPFARNLLNDFEPGDLRTFQQVLRYGAGSSCLVGYAISGSFELPAALGRCGLRPNSSAVNDAPPPRPRGAEGGGRRTPLQPGPTWLRRDRNRRCRAEFLVQKGARAGLLGVGVAANFLPLDRPL